MALRATLLPLLASLASLSHAGTGGEELPALKVSGFGTVGLVHSSEREADFLGDRFQPNGAGHTRSIDLNPDSKLGVQLDARLGEKLSGVVQLVSKHQWDNSFTPEVEWINLKYQFTPDISARLGRIALPSYLISDSRFVGYAGPWVRPPVEVYGVLPITKNDGIDASVRTRIGGATNTVQAYFGTGKGKFPGGTVKSNPAWGLNNTIDVGSLTLRAGYNSVKVDLEIGELNPLLSGLAQLSESAAAVPLQSFQDVAARARILSDRYKPTNMQLSSWTLGANYDPGTWFVMAELVSFKGAGFLTDSTSWYTTGGYRFGNLTPFVSYASTRARVPQVSIDTSGAPPLAPDAAALSDGISGALNGLNAVQHSASIGTRWDFMRNAAFKAQVDRIALGTNSNGRLDNVQPGFKPGGRLTVISVAVDFVF